MMSYCRQTRLLHWLLLLFMALQLGPQGAVACLRADGSHSYGADCSCSACQDDAQHDECCSGAGRSCKDGARLAAGWQGQPELAAKHAAAGVVQVFDVRAKHSCCADHQLHYQNSGAKKVLERAAAQLLSAAPPAAYSLIQAAAQPWLGVARPTAPPGPPEPGRAGILILRI